MMLRGLVVLVLCLSGCDGSDCGDEFCDEGGERDAFARGVSMTTSRETPVYESVPVYRNGWRFAEVIDELEHGTRIVIDASRKVAVPTLSLRTWYRVSYKTNQGEARTGWAYAGVLDPMRSTNINAFIYETPPMPTAADGYRFGNRAGSLGAGTRVRIEETRKLVVSPSSSAVWHRVTVLRDGIPGGTGWMLDSDLE